MQSESLSRSAAESQRAQEIATSVGTSESLAPSERIPVSASGSVTSVVASSTTSTSQSETTSRSESTLTSEREQAAAGLRATSPAANITQSAGRTVSETAAQSLLNSLHPQGNSLSNQTVSGTAAPSQLASVVSVT